MLKRLFKRIIEARERQAEYVVAQMLRDSEFKNESVDYVKDQIMPERFRQTWNV